MKRYEIPAQCYISGDDDKDCPCLHYGEFQGIGYFTCSAYGNRDIDNDTIGRAGEKPSWCKARTLIVYEEGDNTHPSPWPTTTELTSDKVVS